MNGDESRPPPLEPVVFRPCITAVDHMNGYDKPPPLERVLIGRISTQDGDDDLPPPLEPVPAVNCKMRYAADCYPVTLVVADFPVGTTLRDLERLFQEFCPLKITIIVNEKLPSPEEKTFAYVTLPDRKLAEAALYKLDDLLIHKHRLIVTYLLERIPNC